MEADTALDQVRSELKQRFVERDEIVDGLLIALLAGTLMIPFKKSSQEKLGERRKDRFYQRFTSRQRAMTKDLRRRKGKHYRWLVHDFLSISPLHRKSFRCLLRLEKKQANQLLKQAQSKRRSDVDMLASWLTSLAYRAKTKGHNCALLFHYLKDPASFERSILEKYNNESTFFLLNYIDLQKTHKREFLCHLRSNRTSLIQAFNLMKKREQRDRGVDQLDRILKSARARTLNRAIRCGL